MIVPFLFTLDEYSNQFPTYLWVFYKFLDFAKKYNYPVIAQEKFFGDIDNKISNNHIAKNKDDLILNDYELPNINQLKSNFKYRISDEEEKAIIGDQNIGEIWVEILQKKSKKLEEIIDKKIKMIVKEKGKIDAIITWVWNPSLESACKKNNIALIQYELSTIRKNSFNMTLGYFQFCNKYDSKYSKSHYDVFKKNKKLMFDREELLSLFLNTNSLDNIKYLYRFPEYKIGYALGLDDDKFEMAYSKMTNEEVFSKIEDKYLPEDVLIRTHPRGNYDTSKLNFEIDLSITASEWISRCDSIISNISNIAYEVILYGKNLININDLLPTSFDSFTDLNFFDDEKIGLEKLNFLTFYCYCPYDLMFDKDYIYYRLSKPSIIDIYNYNLKYVLKQKNIDYEKIKKMKQYKRLDYILKKVHGLDNKEVKKIREYSKFYTYEKMEKTIIMQKKHINKLNLQVDMLNSQLYSSNETINMILQSISWKVTAPMRNTMILIKKIKSKLTNKK